MATRTSSRRKSASSSNRGRATSRAGARGRSSASSRSRSAARATADRRAARADAARRYKEEAGRQFQGHGRDIWGIVLLVLGVLTALGLASHAAGGVGSALADGLGASLGLGRFGVPVLCIGLAAGLFWARPRFDLDLADDEPRVVTARAGARRTGEPAPIRVAAGLVLLGLAAVGGLHLIGGRPALDASLHDLRDAGGVLGVLVGGGLAAAAGVVGATVILAGLAILGALLTPGLPFRTVLAGIGRGGRWVAHRAREYTELPEADPNEPLAEPVAIVGMAGGDEPVDAALADDPRPVPVRLYDQADDGYDEHAHVHDHDHDHVESEPDPVEIRVTPVVDAGPGAQMAIDLPAAHGKGSWTLPSPSLLKRGDAKGVERSLVEEGGRTLEAALHQHGVDARLTGMTVGPTVTRYELELAPGVKVNRVTSLGHDIAYAMASPDVRILAPIPGRSAIGVEVPNAQRQLVSLGDILMSKEAADATHPLEVGLGRDIAGRPVMLNLATLPHVLIAGATGAGKSSCINSLVTSLIVRNTPEQVRLILVDPKRVELGAYNDVPHLLTPVVTNPKKAANALEWAVREMDMRYELLAEVGVRDITGYNAAFDRGELATVDEPDAVTGKGYDRLPFIVIVVDELNDLMMVAARDVENSICRIAQMARAVGIHLVIATQRPSVDVITGVIKANVPSRLAFSVTSLADSRVILDQAGAEKLIGKGDLLMVTASSSRSQRIQGAWVDEGCVRKIAAHWKRQMVGPTYVDGVAEDTAGSGGSSGGGSADDDDELLGEALDLVVRSGLGSTSMLQRKLRVGFSRAGRLMDLLERRGIVGPSEGSKARTVLMSVEELEAMQERTGA